MDATEIERTIVDRPLPDFFPLDDGWVWPRYDGLSIANLPASIAALLGAELPGALPPISHDEWHDWSPGLRRIVLVLLDALGYRLLQQMLSQGEGQVFAQLAEAGSLTPLTSVFPSTTDAALLSLATGVPPATHGWLAYLIYLREMGIAANAILLSPALSRQSDLLVSWGLDPMALVPVPRLAERLAAGGVSTAAVVSSHFRDSAFTQMLHQGVSEIRDHRHASDLWVQVRKLLADTRGQRVLVTVYWSGLDTLGHTYGQDTDQWAAEFRAVSYLLGHEFLANLPAEDRDGTLLLITADHGQVHVPSEGILTATRDRELSQHLLVPILGESRAAFVYPRSGRAQAIRDRLDGAYPGWFSILDSARALDAGLMGLPVADESYARAGELLVLPRRLHALQHMDPPVPLIGRHGGLSTDEMLVPLIGVRLEALR